MDPLYSTHSSAASGITLTSVSSFVNMAVYDPIGLPPRANAALSEFNEHLCRLESLEMIHLFPASTQNALFDNLIHLTRFSDKAEVVLRPFTEKQCALLRTNEKVSRVTAGCLKHGLWGTTALSIAPSCIAVIPVVSSWAQKDPSHTVYMAVVLNFITACVNLFNFLSTGWYPDRSAKGLTAAQYQVTQTTKSYEEMGNCLLELTETAPELAKLIGSKLDLNQIKDAIEGCGLSEEIASDHCRYLFHAKQGVENGGLLPNAPDSLRRTLRLVEQGRRISALEAILVRQGLVSNSA